MTSIEIVHRVSVLIVVGSVFLAKSSPAQQPAQAKLDAPAVRQEAGAKSSEASAKVSILNSAAWKQAYDEFQKWLASQTIYTPADIARIKANLLAQIRDMPASDLQGFLNDWQAKLRVLHGRDFQDAQQWLGEYLSMMADGFRRQTLIRLGVADFPNMTAGRLEDAFIRVRAHRLSVQQRQTAFNQNRHQRVQRVLQNNAATEQARQQSGAAQFATHQSPYRPPRFDPPPPRRTQFFVDGNGRIGFVLPN